MKLKLFTIGLLATLAMTSTNVGAMQKRKAEIQAAKESPVLKQAIVSHEGLRDALLDPANTIINGSPLDRALRAASGDAASAARGRIAGMPGGTADEKITALQLVEASPAAADRPHKIAIRQALHLKSDPASLVGGSPETAGIRRFYQLANIELVEHPAVAAALVGVPGGATPQLKLAAILVRLNAATHNAVGGAGLVAPAAADIQHALVRAGL